MRTTIAWYYSERGEPAAIGIFVFEHSVTIEDPEKAARDAIFAFVDTDDGRETVVENNYDFNWGDAAQEMDERDWAKFGLKLVDTIKADIVVNHDESFAFGEAD
jgi:hypothetical protein